MVALAAAGITICASTFGIFLASLLKTSRQAGIVFGGLMTVTGMVGMMSIFSGSKVGETVSLLAPQGWAVRGLLLSMNGAAPGDALLNLVFLLAWSALFFFFGIKRFQKRFA